MSNLCVKSTSTLLEVSTCIWSGLHERPAELPSPRSKTFKNPIDHQRICSQYTWLQPSPGFQERIKTFDGLLGPDRARNLGGSLGKFLLSGDCRN